MPGELESLGQDTGVEQKEFNSRQNLIQCKKVSMKGFDPPRLRLQRGRISIHCWCLRGMCQTPSLEFVAYPQLVDKMK